MEHVKTEGDAPVKEVEIADCGELTDSPASNGHVRLYILFIHSLKETIISSD